MTVNIHCLVLQRRNYCCSDCNTLRTFQLVDTQGPGQGLSLPRQGFTVSP